MFSLLKINRRKKKRCSTISPAMLLSPASVSHRNDPSRLHPRVSRTPCPPNSGPGALLLSGHCLCSCSPHMCVEQESGEFCIFSSTRLPPRQEVPVFSAPAGCPVRARSPASPHAQLRLSQLYLPQLRLPQVLGSCCWGLTFH